MNPRVQGIDSGTLQGAGGVGGLLAVIRDDGVFYPCYDANGNITEYVDASGTVRAHYEYSPFGETITQSGDLADTFAFRFSTKYFDTETQSYYYGYRHYTPKLGRWLSRDPLEERGGLNLHGFVGNNPINKVDYLGEVEWEGTVTINDRELHEFGCPEWTDFSGQADAASYYGHFKEATFGKHAGPVLATIPLTLPDKVKATFSLQTVTGLGMTIGDKKTLWSVIIENIRLAYSKKYKQGEQCVRDVIVQVLVFQIETKEKGSSEITLVFKDPPPKEVRTDTQTIQVRP